MENKEEKEIRFIYDNHRGELKRWRVIPRNLYWGKTEYCPTEQWLLEAWDIDKQEIRTFAFNKIIN